MLASVSGNVSDPYVSSALVVVAVVCAFSAGLGIRSALDYANSWFDAKLEKAAERTVDGKMAEAVEKFVYVHDGVMYQGEDAVKAREKYGDGDYVTPPWNEGK